MEGDCQVRIKSVSGSSRRGVTPLAGAAPGERWVVGRGQVQDEGRGVPLLVWVPNLGGLP